MADEPKPNLDLLRKVLRHIDIDREHWYQLWWKKETTCGTAYCVGGWGCVLSGRKFAEDDLEYLDDGTPVIDCAQELFGLTDNETVDLFHSCNSREDVENVANQIAARAGEPLWPEEVAHA
jgi:hypothetical protein